MVDRRTGGILRPMRALLAAGTFSGMSDRELLERYLERRDEVSELAFAVLVERHGPMVLGVCRRIVGDPHDADDAFQATFLVLARRARTIRVEGSLGRWLFGVATRVATRARSDDRRRRLRERSGLDRLDPAGSNDGPAGIDRADLQATIAREVAGLPDRFQAPVLLCDLEGTSCEEAARRLGWPVGTVKSRLSRGRARLRERLARRGLTPADLSLWIPAWRAVPPPALVTATSRAALVLISGPMTTAGLIPAAVATLTQGVFRTMISTRLKIAATALLLTATGSAALLAQATAQKPGSGEPRPASTVPPTRASTSPANGEQVDLEMLERAWIDAINRRDKAVVGRLLADDFEGIDQAGNPFDKPAALREPLLGAFLTDAYAELEQIKTRVFGDTAVATSRFKVRDSAARGAMTHVYVRRRGRWQCVASHASWTSGGFCPALGQTAERTPLNSIRETRNLRQPSDSMASNCMSCHGTPHRETRPIETPPPPVRARDIPRRALKLGIDYDGRISIDGRPIPPDQTLEQRLRIAREREGLTDLSIILGLGAPDDVIAKVAHAAARAGFEEFTQIRAPDGAETRIELKGSTAKDRGTRDRETGP